ncbi:hypothetical protein A7K94_0222045, partial [Modestobacter sp. VKM Ac-2676]
MSLVSLPANLLAAPVVAPATVLGLLAALLSPLSGTGADALTWLAGWPVRWLVLVARTAAAVPDGAPPGRPGGPVRWRWRSWLGVVCWTLVRWPRLRVLALAALLGAVVIGWPLRQAGRGWPLPDTVVVACDVGQGDALVFPDGAAGRRAGGRRARRRPGRRLPGPARHRPAAAGAALAPGRRPRRRPAGGAHRPRGRRGRHRDADPG